MDPHLPFLVTLSGQDAPGLAQRLFAALEAGHIDVRDVEQVRVHGRVEVRRAGGLAGDSSLDAGQ